MSPYEADDAEGFFARQPQAFGVQLLLLVIEREVCLKLAFCKVKLVVISIYHSLK